MIFKSGWSFGVVIFVIILLVVVSSGVASAADVTYRWVQDTGTTVATGVTTNWASCGATPRTGATSLLTDGASSGCNADDVSIGTAGTITELFFDTAYSVDTNVAGNWYYTTITQGGSTATTYTFSLIYAYPNGTIGVLPGTGSVSGNTLTAKTDFNVSLTGIDGTVPAGAKLGVRIEKDQTYNTRVIYFGDTNDAAGSGPTGYFSVTETLLADPTYNVSVTPSPTSAGVIAGGNYSYPITVYNNGNTAGNYNLTVSDSDSTNFSASVLGASILYVTSGGSNSTTVTVTAQGGATVGAVDISIVTVTSLDNSSYSNTTQVTTTVETSAPAVSVTLTPSSKTVGIGSNADYTVTVQNTGNTVDSYTLSINSANTSDFGYTLASTSTGSLNPGQEYATTVTVYGLAGATAENTHGQSVTATGTASDTSNSVTTMVQSGPAMILVATNRFVILDDPIIGTKTAQSTFATPIWSGWTDNLWDTDQTNITLYAMLLDENGIPANNVAVDFTVRNWDSSFSQDLTTVYTGSDGIVNSTFNMNNRDYYGNWYVDANATEYSLSGTSNFIYNWWGCMADGAGDGCNQGGGGDHGGSVGSMGATPGEQNSPYTLGRDDITDVGSHSGMTIQDDVNCVGCHRSYSGEGGGTDFENQATSSSGAHSSINCYNCHGNVSTTHNSDQTIKSCDDASCHSRTEGDISDISTMSGTPSESLYSGGAGPAKYHDSESTVPCIICHGPMHNITKPYPGAANYVTEDSHCTTCHSGLSKHNNAVGCTECHSEDAHTIKYLQTDESFATTTASAVDCTTCHQGSGLASFSSAGKIAKISHSENTLNGSLWSEGRTGNFWTNSSEVSKCDYCHGDSKHMLSGVGKPAQFNGTSDIVGGDLTGAWCGLCHYQLNPKYSVMISTMGSGYVPPEISGNATYGTYTDGKGSDGTTGYFDHGSSYTTDSDCAGCHDGNSATNISQFMHNVSSGGGGPDCVACHDSGKSNQHVDVSAINDSTNIHAGLNSGAADTTGNSDNKICWGCHQADGAQPSGHPDKLTDPYTCYECHDGTPPSHASDALAVSNHFKSGTNLTSVSGAANNTASCLECHNKAEMMASYTEPDSINTTMSLVSHYGIKRTTGDLSNYNTSAYCAYCHNATNEFDALVTGINASITNHSNSVSGPSCANVTCHNTGRIHDITLKIPTVTPTLCKSCHTTKVEHNNSVACADCHMTDDTQIHAIRFLQPDESFSTVSATAVDCATCHQGGGLANFSNATEVGMVRHSQNTLNGSLWDRGSAFWTNTSETTKCEFCHGDSKHDASALGSVDDFKGSNTVDADLTGTWCSGCHYQNDANYNTMVATLSIIPPEITGNATYGDYTTANDGTTTYFDHSAISGFTDADCADCHDKNGSTMISPFMHNVSLNNGGADCTACHNIGGPIANVNISEIVNGSHSGMNSAADLTGVTNGTQLCWSCHGDGSRPEEHPSNYNAPHYCDDCHSPGNVSSPLVINETVSTIYRHAAGAGGRNQINKSQLVCEDCHVNMLTISSPAESTLAQVAHYTNNSTSSGWLTCNDGCHKDVPLGAAYAGAEQTTMGGVGAVGCMYCHNFETVANGFSSPPLGEGRNATDGSVSLHNKSITLISTSRCFDAICHDDPRL